MNPYNHEDEKKDECVKLSRPQADAIAGILRTVHATTPGTMWGDQIKEAMEWLK